MEKVKNLVLLTVFSICSLFLFGVGKVYALKNPSIVCTPAAVEANEKTTCVLYGNFVDDEKSYYAMLLHVGLTDLEYVNGKSSISSGWGDKVAIEYFASTGESNKFEHLSDSNGAVACKALITDGSKESCVLLYSASESKPAIKNNPSNNSKLTEIAKFELVLKPSSANVKKCGKICVIGTSYETNGSAAVAFSSSKDCKEVEVQGENKPEPVPTGNFTSYIILAAGAFIAICAVLVAKKNNRFYRV